MRARTFLFLCAAALFAALLFIGSPVTAQKNQTTSAPNKSMVERGKYLTIIGGCNDCHTPKTFTKEGPVPDMTRELSGHPAGAKVPEVPASVIGPQGWGALSSNDFTAWAGVWGISFAANLTPDLETGTGNWTEEMFIKAIRTGKHLGAPDGRAILPPMPWPEYRKATDQDLKAIFAYLRTLKPIRNAVPEPIPPAGAPQTAK
jgi:hypothetical protein